MANRLLVIGGQGMLGHKLWQVAHDAGIDTWATVRRLDGHLMVSGRALGLEDATDARALRRAIEDARPDVVVNCVGIVKQSTLASDPMTSLRVNAVLPARLSVLCQSAHARFIHISTDCVFSGAQGHYRETDVPDAEDIYGLTKLVGEVGAPALTLRTSMIGRELSGRHGLVEWFLGEQRPVKGYRGAVFSGLTTLELARVIVDVIAGHPALAGLYHLAAAAIDKHTLLTRLGEAFGHDIPIEAVDQPAIDRGLNGAAFLERTGRRVPGWDQMIREMAADSRAYAQWRQM